MSPTHGLPAELPTLSLPLPVEMFGAEVEMQVKASGSILLSWLPNALALP